MNIRKVIGSLAILGASLSSPALAQDCKPLQLIDTIPMTTLPGETRRTVPVSVDGTPLNLLLDTGGFATSVLPRAADKAKLHIQKSSDIKLYTIEGNSTSQTAAVEQFMIGRLRFSKTRLIVLPLEQMEGKELPFDGLLAANMLFNYDIELNFADNSMRYFMTDHCPGKVIYWKPAAVGVVPIVLQDKAHIQVEVTLDGQTFDAVVDSGATATVMSSTMAKAFFGLDGPGADDQIVEGSDPKDPRYVHTFDKLSFGDITVLKPRITVYPDHFRDRDRTQQTGNRAMRDADDVKRAPLLIGMNILQRLHLYMAFGEKKFYVTPASTPAAAK
jgi:predicted aspartyl protease